MNYQVVFAPEAEAQLVELYRFISVAASPVIAARYTNAIVDYCMDLANFPLCGTMRDDVRPGLRITHYKKRAVIAFAVDGEQVLILRVFYGGRDYESILQESSDGESEH